MKIQLYSIDHAPLRVPYWPAMMDDLCQPPATRVARVLGISVRTVRRYNATGYAPRVACLAVFWLTSWGRESVHIQATNDARLMVSYVESLRSQVQALDAQLAHVQALGGFGSANDPAIGNTRRPPNALVR